MLSKSDILPESLWERGFQDRISKRSERLKEEGKGGHWAGEGAEGILLLIYFSLNPRHLSFDYSMSQNAARLSGEGEGREKGKGGEQANLTLKGKGEEGRRERREEECAEILLLIYLSLNPRPLSRLLDVTKCSQTCERCEM